jgi:hypothetical protein
MGGNLVNYPDNCGTPTADIITVKLLLNSIISTNNVKFTTIDLKDFYLMTPMRRYEYFRMKLDLFPNNIIEESFAKYIVVCTAFPRPASLRKNSSKSAFVLPVTPKAS